jgi:hypothetical protein
VRNEVNLRAVNFLTAVLRIAWHRIIAALLLVTITLGLAQAETLDDQGLWFLALGQGSFGNAAHEPAKLRWWLDVQARFANEADGFTQGIVRPGLGYAITESATVWLGYAWIPTSPASGSDYDEHRIWQQLTWSKPIKRVSFSSRTRLEQRFRDGGSDTGWRLRQFFKVAYALPGNPDVSLIGYDELFFGLNNTDWGASSGFDRNRLFLGVGWRLGESGNSLEIGYLNQFIDSASGTDQMEHILSFNLFLNY